jgi:hypothetical protein
MQTAAPVSRSCSEAACASPLHQQHTCTRSCFPGQEPVLQSTSQCTHSSLWVHTRSSRQSQSCIPLPDQLLTTLSTLISGSYTSNGRDLQSVTTIHYAVLMLS